MRFKKFLVLLIFIMQFNVTAEASNDTCDNLAGNPYDEHFSGKGVSFEELNAEVAIPACQKASSQSDNPRFTYQLGRAYSKTKQYKKAAKWYKKAADKGYGIAYTSLGLLYIRGKGVNKDPKKAIDWFRKGAERDIASAKTMLGDCYKYGVGADKNLKKATKWYRKAAEQGYAQAQNSLGFNYETGDGVNKDLKEANKWYRKAAEQGYARAQTNLANNYTNGVGIDKDLKKATKWYRKAAEQGYAHAQTNLGLNYETGDGVNKDLKEANKWYRKAAEQGYARAQTDLGLNYETGDGVNKDLKEANKWYRKAAEQGYARAQTYLGVNYEYGEGLKQDFEKAIKWYRKASDQDHTSAQKRLSILYYKNKNGSIPPKYHDAFLLAQKAANKGNKIAQYYLATMYSRGIGVNKNKEKAIKWFEKSAAQGSSYSRDKLKSINRRASLDTGIKAYDNADYQIAYNNFSSLANTGNEVAMHRLGMMYWHGHGIKNDDQRAVLNIRHSAYKGYGKAQFVLCDIFTTSYKAYEEEGMYWCDEAAENNYPAAFHKLGELSVRDDLYNETTKSLEYFQKAADLNHIPSYIKLSEMYSEAFLVKKDPEKAFNWMQRAAETGSIVAQNKLGLLYSRTDLGKKNYVKAAKWFFIAENRTTSTKYRYQIRRNMKRLLGFMNSSDREKAKRLASEWLSEH